MLFRDRRSPGALSVAVGYAALAIALPARVSALTSSGPGLACPAPWNIDSGGYMDGFGWNKGVWQWNFGQYPFEFSGQQSWQLTAIYYYQGTVVYSTRQTGRGAAPPSALFVPPAGLKYNKAVFGEVAEDPAQSAGGTGTAACFGL